MDLLRAGGLRGCLHLSLPACQTRLPDVGHQAAKRQHLMSSSSTCPACSVDVRLKVGREVKVADVGQVADVQPSGSHICGHQQLALAASEGLDCSFTLLLGTLAVYARHLVGHRFQGLKDGLHCLRSSTTG